MLENNISFTYQKKFEDCKNVTQLIFDFYIPKFNICIEFNGIQHYQPIEYFGGIEGFKLIKKRDEIKKNYCKSKKIKFRTITYKNDIIKKLTKLLK